MTKKSNDDAIKIYQHVISELSKIIGAPVKEVFPHVVELPTPLHWYQYVRTSTAAFWGLSPNKVELVEKTCGERWSVLLVDGRVRTYLNDDGSEHERVDLFGIYNILPRLYYRLMLHWTRLKGEYRINEGAKDLGDVPAFSSLRQMIDGLKSAHVEIS